MLMSEVFQFKNKCILFYKKTPHLKNFLWYCCRMFSGGILKKFIDFLLV